MVCDVLGLRTPLRGDPNPSGSACSCCGKSGWRELFATGGTCSTSYFHSPRQKVASTSFDTRMITCPCYDGSTKLHGHDPRLPVLLNVDTNKTSDRSWILMTRQPVPHRTAPHRTVSSYYTVPYRIILPLRTILYRNTPKHITPYGITSHRIVPCHTAMYRTDISPISRRASARLILSSFNSSSSRLTRFECSPLSFSMSFRVASPAFSASALTSRTCDKRHEIRVRSGLGKNLHVPHTKMTVHDKQEQSQAVHNTVDRICEKRSGGIISRGQCVTFTVSTASC